MTDDDYYRRQAADAQQQADRSRSGTDRASWLRIAQSWLGLIRGKQSATEDFDRGAREQGTNQDVSKEEQ